MTGMAVPKGMNDDIVRNARACRRFLDDSENLRRMQTAAFPALEYRGIRSVITTQRHQPTPNAGRDKDRPSLCALAEYRHLTTIAKGAAVAPFQPA
jgi:hypothetical protein